MTRKDKREFCGVIEIIYIMIVMVVTGLYVYISQNTSICKLKIDKYLYVNDISVNMTYNTVISLSGGIFYFLLY